MAVLHKKRNENEYRKLTKIEKAWYNMSAKISPCNLQEIVSVMCWRQTEALLERRLSNEVPLFVHFVGQKPGKRLAGILFPQKAGAGSEIHSPPWLVLHFLLLLFPPD